MSYLTNDKKISFLENKTIYCQYQKTDYLILDSDLVDFKYLKGHTMLEFVQALN